MLLAILKIHVYFWGLILNTVKKIKKPNLDYEKIVSEFLDFNKEFLIRDLEYYIGFKGYFINTLSNVDSQGCYDDFFEKLFKYFTLSFDTKKML